MCGRRNVRMLIEPYALCLSRVVTSRSQMSARAFAGTADGPVTREAPEPASGQRPPEAARRGPSKILRADVLVGGAWGVQGPFGSAETGPHQAAHLISELGEVVP